MWTLAVLAVLCVVLFQVSQHFQAIQMQRDSSDIAHHVEQKARQVQGLLNSLVSAHYATAGDQSAIVAMAEQLRLDNPKINAVGRYQTVQLWQRKKFEETMTESGLYAFHIADLVGAKRVPSVERLRAKPISFLEPMTPEMLPLLGIDLAADERLEKSLTRGNCREFNRGHCCAG